MATASCKPAARSSWLVSGNIFSMTNWTGTAASHFRPEPNSSARPAAPSSINRASATCTEFIGFAFTPGPGVMAARITWAPKDDRCCENSTPQDRRLVAELIKSSAPAPQQALPWLSPRIGFLNPPHRNNQFYLPADKASVAISEGGPSSADPDNQKMTGGKDGRQGRRQRIRQVPCGPWTTRPHQPRLVAEPAEPRPPAPAFAAVRSDGRGLRLRRGVQEPRPRGREEGPRTR